MNYTKTERPKTQSILRASFVISAGLVAWIESLNLQGPGTWAEGYAGDGKVRVYNPDELQADQLIYGTIQRHVSPQEREYKRIIFSPTTVDEANVIESDEKTFITQAAAFLGEGDSRIQEMLFACGLEARVEEAREPRW